MISIDKSKCTGCKLCIKSCPHSAIQVTDKKAEIDLTLCTLCGLCIGSCKKEKAISFSKLSRYDKTQLSQYSGITVFIETFNDSICPISIEILSEARKLAQKSDIEVIALLIGDKIEYNSLYHYGADEIVLYKSHKFINFRNELFTDIVVDYIHNHKPAIFLAGATSIGRSFIPRVATEVRSGVTADCTKLEISKKDTLLLGTRPAFGGNLMATIICENSRPQFATIRQHVMKVEKPDLKRKGKITIINNFTPKSNPISRITEIIEDNASNSSITEADIIVAGGLGIGSKENFEQIIKLADILGGAYAASRSAVDLGWAPYSHQVGQTGKTVNPKLYIAIGISGAIQHVAGMQSSDYIIAINSDPNAEIFNIADAGFIGDALEILPNLIKKIK